MRLEKYLLTTPVYLSITFKDALPIKLMDNVTFANMDTIKTSMHYVPSIKKSTSINVAFNVTPMDSVQNVLKDFIYKNSTAKETLLMAV